MKFKKAGIFTAILAAIFIFLYAQNNLIGNTRIVLEFDRLPKGFDGYTIVHLSDLHSKFFGKKQYQLVSKVKQAKPDLIVLTGDMVDSNRYEEEPLMKLIEGIIDIAPVYYVTGNHECGSRKFNSLERKLKKTGVKVLRNESEWLQRNGSKILIAGIDDPLFSRNREDTKHSLEKILKGNRKEFKILLSHRPELFSTYVDYDIDLVFSGHAHGGQVRLPFVGGLMAPGQGFFPKYTSGKHIENNSILIISRGLGNSMIPQRIFNRPEVIVTTLKRKN